MRCVLVALCVLTVIAAGLPPDGGASARKAPFQPGEKLTFELKWELIPAGTAVFEVLPMEIIDGERVYHFAVTVKSNAFVDKFYKVRDRIDAYADEKMTRSVLYRKKQREGKHRRDEVVIFDWEKSQVRYSNFGKEREPLPVSPGTFDPLSVFYAFRLQPLRENMEVRSPVTDGKKKAEGRAVVHGKERIEVGDREYNAFLVEPDMKDVGGVFKKSRDARLQVWISSDESRVPVKVKSKVVVGSFTGELVSIERSG